MTEHPVQQPIRGIDIYADSGTDMVSYNVGRLGVTRIEACEKSGLHANIPYVRVWKGEVCEAEFCQHNIVGVYFAEVEAPARATARTVEAPPGGWPADHTGEPSCLCTECIPF